MDGNPSSLRVGDLAVVQVCGQSVAVVVVEVHTNGAFVGPVDEHGVRKLARQQWCSDDSAIVIEVNGVSLFEV